MTTKNPLYVHLVLDRSGSMEDCRDETISAFNEYLSTLTHAEDTDARITLTQFSARNIDLIADQIPVADMPRLTRATYEPGGNTPLFDAVGVSVAHTDKAHLRPGEKVSLVILTDGMENTSREHNIASVRKLLDNRQKDKGWQVVFLGADAQSWSQGVRFGAHHGKSLLFAKRSIGAALHSVSRAQRSFSKGENDDFTDKERHDSNKS